MDILDCGQGVNEAFDQREAEAALARPTGSAFDAGFSACEARVRKELGGHECSELWGADGLIAATMRCVAAVQEQPCCGRPMKDCDCEPKTQGKTW